MLLLSVPVLEVFFIDFSKPMDKQTKIKNTLIRSAAYTFGGPIGGLLASAHLKTLGEDVKSLRRLVDEKRFNIIKTREELKHYINPSGNAWVINSKELKQRQYYVKHPQKDKQNILIEAKNFYNYIENEHRAELVNFITSHCTPKSIRIEREEITGANGNVAASVEGANISGSASGKSYKFSVFNQTWPNGAPKTEPREHYLWLDESFKDSITMLTGGSSVEDSYICEFGCGLSLKEAQTLGLNMEMHKKFSYKIYVQC